MYFSVHIIQKRHLSKRKMYTFWKFVYIHHIIIINLQSLLSSCFYKCVSVSYNLYYIVYVYKYIMYMVPL